ncbi:MAG: hypothetical protein F6K11_16670 [Leptolyngbya sp. SIO3F4]|nr:hypothetical protein [Leptolyngbya sp. SIO3F4]
MFAEKSYINTESVNGQKTPSTESKNNQSPIGSGAQENSSQMNEVITDFRQTLQKNLLEYEDRYRKTGQLDFMAFEVVARMAEEGTVLVPDHAEERMQHILTSAQKVQTKSLELQSTLLDSTVHEGRCESARLKLLELHQATIMLVTTVDQHVMPLAGIVSVQKKIELDNLLQELKKLLAYFLEQFGKTNFGVEQHSSGSNPRIIRHLTLLIAKAQSISIVSVEIIKARVPFYRLVK